MVVLRRGLDFIVVEAFVSGKGEGNTFGFCSSHCGDDDGRDGRAGSWIS